MPGHGRTDLYSEVSLLNTTKPVMFPLNVSFVPQLLCLFQRSPLRKRELPVILPVALLRSHMHSQKTCSRSASSSYSVKLVGSYWGVYQQHTWTWFTPTILNRDAGKTQHKHKIPLFHLPVCSRTVVGNGWEYVGNLLSEYACDCRSQVVKSKWCSHVGSEVSHGDGTMQNES